MFLSVPLVSLDGVCYSISLCDPCSPERLPQYCTLTYYVPKGTQYVYCTCMSYILYSNVCISYTACSSFVCERISLVCCIVSPPWPSQEVHLSTAI